MISEFADPQKMSGVYDPAEEQAPNTETRSFGTMAKDELARAAAVPVGWLRTATNTARAAEEGIRGGPAEIMEPVDKAVASAQRYLEDVPSARSKAIDQDKWFPKYGERSARDEPITAVAHGIAPLVPYVALARKATGVGGLGTFGAIGAGEAANKVRDFADTTPREELNKLPVFQDMMREFGNDERAARTALFQRSVDLVSELTNAGANMLTFGALQHALTSAGLTSVQRPVADAVKRLVFGGGEGLVVGAATGATSNYGEQKLKVDTGQQQAIDVGAMGHASAESGFGQAPLIGAMHLARGQPPPPAAGGDKAPPGGKPPVTPPEGIDPGVKAALDGQLNDKTTSSDSTRIDPDLENRVIAQRQAQGYGDLANQRGLTPPPPPPPPGTPPAEPPAAAMNVGPPPVQPVQPKVTTTPPVRTPPVTPAPTPVQAPAPATALAPAPAPEAAPQRAMVDGKPVTLVGEPVQHKSGATLQRVVGDDGERGIVPVDALQPLTSEVTVPVPTAAPVEGGLAKVREVQAKKAAPVAAPVVEPVKEEVSAPAPAPAPARVQTATLEIPTGKPATLATRQRDMRKEIASTEDPALKKALLDVSHPTSDFDELQAAADFGRANNRNDITSLAIDRANDLAKQAERRQPPQGYQGAKRETSSAGLKATAIEARRRAAEVAAGGRPKEPAREEPAREEQVLKETKAPQGETEAPKVTTEVKPNAARTLKRDDIVTMKNGKTFKVINVAERKDYPQDPRITIAYPGVHDHEEHRASELDQTHAAVSIERAEVGKLTKSGKPRQKPEELNLPVGKRVAVGERTPPSRFPNYEYVGTNDQGHHLWENPNPKRPLRVATYLQKTSKGKPRRIVTHVEMLPPRVAGEPRVTINRYSRPDYYKTKEEVKKGIEQALPPRVHRVFEGKPETTPRAAPEHVESRERKTREQQELDTEASTVTHRLRNEAAMEAPPAEAAKPFEGIPKPVRPRLTLAKEPVPRPEALEAHENKLAEDIRQFNAARRLTDAPDLSERQAALERRAKNADSTREAQGVEPIFEKMMAVDLVAQRQARGYAELAAQGESAAVARRQAAGFAGLARARERGPVREEPSSVVQSEYEAAKALADAQRRGETPEQLRERYQKSFEEAQTRAPLTDVQEQAVKEARRETTMENAPVTRVTPELKEKISREFTRRKLPGTLDDYIHEAEQRILAERKKEQGDARGLTLREKLTAQREGVISSAITDAIIDPFNGDGKAIGKFLNDLVGDLQAVVSRDPVTNERVVRYASADYPKPPEEVLRRAKPGKIGAPKSTDVSEARYQDALKVYEARVTAWNTATSRQMQAADKLREILGSAIVMAKRRIENYRIEHGYTGESIRWNLPRGEPTDTGYLRFRAGKGEEAFAMYNFINDLQRVHNKLEVDLKALAEGGFRIGGKRDLALERRRYRTGLATTLQNFAVDMRNFLGNDMRAIDTARNERNEKVTSGFRIADTSSLTGEGEHVGLHEARLEHGAESVTSEADQRSMEDIVHDSIAKDQKVQEDARVLRDKERRANMSAEQEAQENRKQLLKDFPLRSQQMRYTGKVRPGMSFDVDGLPTEGKRWVEGELYTRDGVDDAHEALQGANPSHPLIDAPMSARAVADTVKTMIQRGEQGDEISKAITPRFLDQLAKALQGVPIYHANHEVVSAAGTDAPAYYNAANSHIVLSKDGTNAYYTRTAVHEMVHALTHNMLERDPAFRAEVEDLLAKARHAAVRDGLVPKDFDFESRFSPTEQGADLPRHVYGLINAHEFLSEAKGSEAFRRFLARVPSGQETIGNKVRNAINSLYRVLQKGFAKLMGRTDGDTALDALFADQSSILGKADRTVARVLGDVTSGKRVRDMGLPDGFRRSTALSQRVEMPRARHPAEGTEHVKEALTTNLRGYAGRTVKSAIETGRHIGENRARGLGLHTLFDMGQRTGDREFQGHMQEVTKIEGQVAHEQARILADQDGPIIENIGRFLRGLSAKSRDLAARALIEETQHRAYLDAPLGERDAKGKLIGKNAHIDPTDLGWTQTAAEHDWLRKNLFEPVAKIPGFLDIRNSTHKFYENREKQIRSDFIRSMSEANELMPRGMTGVERERTLAALEKHVLNSKDMTPEELRAMDKIDLDNEKTQDKVKDLRQLVREYAHVQGPYVPLVRHGELVVRGRFVLPKPDKGEVVLEKDRRPGPKQDAMVDNGLRVFKTPEDLRAYERQVTRELGIAQLDAGAWHYDPATNERVMRYTSDELAAANKKRAEAGEKPLVNQRASAADVKEMRAQGRAVDTRYWIRFSPHLYERHDSRNEARASVAEWRAKYGDKLQVADVEQAREGSGLQAEQHLSATMNKVINQFKSREAFTDLERHEQAGINQTLQFLTQKAVMHRGVSQRYLPRRYVRGASNDIVRSLRDYSGSTSAWLAKMRFQEARRDAWAKLEDYVKGREYEAGDKDHEARATITEYVGKRLHTPSEPMNNGRFSKWIDRLIGWTMLDKLPNLGYFVANGSEPIVLAAPLLVGRHGVVNVGRTMTEAYRIFGPLRMVGEGIGDMLRAMTGKTVRRPWQAEFEARVKTHPMAEGLIDLIGYMSRNGLYDQHAGLEYQRRAGGPEIALDHLQKYLTNIFQAGNTAIENLNRLVTGTSAYLLERRRLDAAQDPEAHAKALHYAWETVHEANGIYNNYNTPAWFNKTPFHRMAFEFKKYPQRIIANYIRSGARAIGMFSQEVRNDPVQYARAKEAARQFTAMLVVQGTVAGMLGMPTEVFSVPVNAMYMAGLTTSNWDDYRAGFRNWAADQFGREAGELLSYGVLRASGADIGSRLSQSDMVFFGAPQSQRVQDIRGAAMGILLGAGGGYAADLMMAIQRAAESAHAYDSGNPTLGLKLAVEATRLSVPFRALVDLIDSNMQAQEAGMETSSGRPRGAPLSIDEQIWKATGFTPVRVANQQEKARTEKRLQDNYNAQRKRFITEFTSPGADKARVWAAIQDWNHGQPDVRQLQYGQLVKAGQTRAAAQRQPLGYAGAALDKRGKSFLPEMHQFE